MDTQIRAVSGHPDSRRRRILAVPGVKMSISGEVAPFKPKRLASFFRNPHEPELRRLRPDIFVVNEDRDVPEKPKRCRELGIDYVVLDRIPHGNLRARSTTDLRQVDQMPYRIDLAGGRPPISHSPMLPSPGRSLRP